jgi:hypothetical protein
MGSEHTEVWASLYGRLRSVVGDLGTNISPGDAAMIMRFADHDEFGIAFEMLRDLLIENQTPLSTATVQAVVELARMMDLDARDAELRRSFARVAR